MKPLKVIELFAGVGGFRVGLERVNSNHSEVIFDTIWSNQWEPSTKKQCASEVYVKAFGPNGHINKDIRMISTDEIPDCDILTAGFPCQDYSVANTLSRSMGLEGSKGSLWWEIYRIVKEKGENAPTILFLENVDRLLSSPSKQRGKDFQTILISLNSLGYDVEYRVVNSADYGMPQRRKRVYILCYKRGTFIPPFESDGELEWITTNGILAKAFPINEISVAKTESIFDMGSISFGNSGLMTANTLLSAKTTPKYNGPFAVLGDIIAKGDDRKYITEDFYIPEEDLEKWKYLKSSKKMCRTDKNGFEYIYSEGAMSFPDSLDKPSRTIITSEGGKSPSRFRHVIEDPENGSLRRLIPLELERLNMFPDNHTIGQSDIKRAFLMGNALVCGAIERIGEALYSHLSKK